jgi:hypothetical protein
MGRNYAKQQGRFVVLRSQRDIFFVAPVGHDYHRGRHYRGLFDEPLSLIEPVVSVAALHEALKEQPQLQREQRLQHRSYRTGK